MRVPVLHQSRWAVSLVLLAIFLLPSSDARPYRGSVKWSVILCKHRGSDTPPRSTAFYQNLFYKHGYNGLADFFDKVSYGNLVLDGSVVVGWFTTAYTLAQSVNRTRGQIWDDCVQAAAAGGYSLPAGRLAALVTYPSRDLYGWPGRGSYMPWDAEVGAYGHEVGHGFGFDHSYSNDPTYRNADWAGIGEYDDPWDTMSYAHSYGTDTGTANFGTWGPGYNAYHRDRMGWIPKSKIYRFGSNGETKASINLASITTFPYKSNYINWMSLVSKLSTSVLTQYSSLLGKRRQLSGLVVGSLFSDKTTLTNTKLDTSIFKTAIPTSSPPATSAPINERLAPSVLDVVLRQKLDYITQLQTNTPASLFKLGSLFYTPSQVATINTPIGSPLTQRDYAVSRFVGTDLLPLLFPPYLMIRIPFDASDPNHYYTVEYRRKLDIDAGIPNDYQVLIHEVKNLKDGSGNDIGYRAYLIRDLSDPYKRPATSLEANGVSIKTTYVGDTATILIQHGCINTPAISIPCVRLPFIGNCLPGTGVNIPANKYVFRQACSNDYVCVREDRRSTTISENAMASTTVDSTRGPSGWCKNGYVWREACSGTEYVAGASLPIDRVCVVPASRTAAWADNQDAANRVVQFAQYGKYNYGPNACVAPFVWRDADDNDYVCVTGSIRTQTSNENSLHASRRDPSCSNPSKPCPYGPQQCLPGYVWRDAFPGDQICVPVSSRSQAAADNSAAQSRLARVNA